MAWAATSRLRLANALGYPLDSYNLISIDAGMASVAQTGQGSIDYVEGLLTQWDAADLAVAASAADAGLIQADVLHWSDRDGGKTAGLLDRLRLITARISAALGVMAMGAASTSGSGAARSSRS